MILSLVSKKGGVGKSTSALGIASAWQHNNRDVCIVDYDPDATLYKLSQKIDLGLPVIVGDAQNVHKQLKNLEHEYVVVDTQPQSEAIISRVSGISDEVLTPLAPSGFDLDRLQDTVAIVEEVEAMRDKPLLSVLITKYRSGVNRSDEVIGLLESQELPVLKSKIRLLDRYAAYGRMDYTDEYKTVLEELEIY